MRFSFILITLFAIGCCVGKQDNREAPQNIDNLRNGKSNENNKGVINDEDSGLTSDLDSDLKRIIAFDDAMDEDAGHKSNQTMKESNGTNGREPTVKPELESDVENTLNNKVSQIEILRNQIKDKKVYEKVKDIEPEIKKSVLETEFNLPANKWGDMKQSEKLHQLESYYQINPVIEVTSAKKTTESDEVNLVDDPNSIGGDAVDRTVKNAKELKNKVQVADDEDRRSQSPVARKIMEDVEMSLEKEEAKDRKKNTNEIIEKIENTKENVIKDDHLAELMTQNHETDEKALESDDYKPVIASNTVVGTIPDYSESVSENTFDLGHKSRDYPEQYEADRMKSSQQKEKAEAMRKAIANIPIFDSYGKADVDDINMDEIRSLTNVDEADEFEDIEVLGDQNDEIDIGDTDVGLGNVQEIVRRRKRDIHMRRHERSPKQEGSFFDDSDGDDDDNDDDDGKRNEKDEYLKDTEEDVDENDEFRINNDDSDVKNNNKYGDNDTDDDNMGVIGNDMDMTDIYMNSKYKPDKLLNSIGDDESKDVTKFPLRKDADNKDTIFTNRLIDKLKGNYDDEDRFSKWHQHFKHDQGSAYPKPVLAPSRLSRLDEMLKKALHENDADTDESNMALDTDIMDKKKTTTHPISRFDSYHQNSNEGKTDLSAAGFDRLDDPGEPVGKPYVFHDIETSNIHETGNGSVSDSKKNVIKNAETPITDDVSPKTNTDTAFAASADSSSRNRSSLNPTNSLKNKSMQLATATNEDSYKTPSQVNVAGYRYKDTTTFSTTTVAPLLMKAERGLGNARWDTNNSKDKQWKEPPMLTNCWAQTMMSPPYDFSPSCNPDGTFSAKQCHLHRCWCVKRDGTSQISTKDKRFYSSLSGLLLRCSN